MPRPPIKKITLLGNGKNINPKNFKADAIRVADKLAVDFVKDIVLPELRKRYKKPLVKKLYSQLSIKDGKLIINNDGSVSNLENWHAIEYGIKDKGILANPIIRNTYPKYIGEYKKRFSIMLKGK